ncbi:MAG TPA: hypothetical protein VKQ70_13220 [Caulobacteraceae bacterium]|jgi:hypothetical protein|nr:hypothetical protein [Caulobacteraceae bacterium]
MLRETRPTRRFGVFATIRGWLLADPDRVQDFDTRTEAMAAARRLAHVTRWRGARAEVVAQDRAGGPLRIIDGSEPDGPQP